MFQVCDALRGPEGSPSGKIPPGPLFPRKDHGGYKGGSHSPVFRFTLQEGGKAVLPCTEFRKGFPFRSEEDPAKNVSPHAANQLLRCQGLLAHAVHGLEVHTKIGLREKEHHDAENDRCDCRGPSPFGQRIGDTL